MLAQGLLMVMRTVLAAAIRVMGQPLGGALKAIAIFSARIA
jgi:hypothetical protein